VVKIGMENFSIMPLSGPLPVRVQTRHKVPPKQNFSLTHPSAPIGKQKPMIWKFVGIQMVMAPGIQDSPKQKALYTSIKHLALIRFCWRLRTAMGWLIR
jgi:hypothetical protein